MAFQIRVAATCRLVNRSTGSTPGRLFKISTSLDPDHWAASAASSFGLLKASVPSWRSSIFSVEAKTVMLLSTSIVNVIKFLSGFLFDDIHPSCRPHLQGNCSTICASKIGEWRFCWTEVGMVPFGLDSLAPQRHGCV